MAIENCNFEMVDLPSTNVDCTVCKLLVYQRLNNSKNLSRKGILYMYMYVYNMYICIYPIKSKLLSTIYIYINTI